MLIARKFVKPYFLVVSITSCNKIGAIVPRKQEKWTLDVGQAMNRLCYASLNIKRHNLAPINDKSKAKWSDFRQGCIQVLNLCY